MDFRKTLENAKEGLGSYSAFAAENITRICKDIGPRPCGGENEKKAQEYIKNLLAQYSDEVRRETFKVHPAAFMAFVPVAGSLVLASTAVNIASAFKKSKGSLAPVAAIGAALYALIGEFAVYKKPLDPFFKEKESGNVIAVRKAAGETKRRIIISGHTDSAPEWTYTYLLGSKGVIIVAGTAICSLLSTSLSAGVNLLSKNKKLKKIFALSQLAFLPPLAALYDFTNPRKYVEGASDDLSGSFVASSVLKYLSDNDIRFENTEVIALLTGGEECGLRGCEAFFKAHPEILNDGVETVYAGFDTVRDEEFMEIYTKDLNGIVKNDIRACNLMKNAAAKCGKDIPFGAIPLGSTDAAAASRAGCPSVSFVAMDPAPARYYHTRLDTAENIIPSTIEKGIEIALQTVFDFDEKGLGN